MSDATRSKINYKIDPVPTHRGRIPAGLKTLLMLVFVVLVISFLLLLHLITRVGEVEDRIQRMETKTTNVEERLERAEKEIGQRDRNTRTSSPPSQ